MARIMEISRLRLGKRNKQTKNKKQNPFIVTLVVGGEAVS